MIANKELAKYVGSKVAEANDSLNSILIEVKKHGSADEFSVVREQVSKIMAELLFSILNPIYRQHPELKPEGLYIGTAGPKIQGL